MKKILIVPGNLFVSRNYFSSPLIENLKRISIKDNLRIIVAEVEGNPIDDNTFDCSSGLQSRDFIYIDDLINAIIKTLINRNTNGEILNIGSGKPIKIKNLISKICKLVGYGNPQFGKIKFRKDEIKKLYPDISKAKLLLNWQPKISLSKGLINTINYYKSTIKF